MATTGGANGGGGAGEDGGDLNQAVEAFFGDSENAVVMAFRVAKSQASWSVAGRRTRHSTKPRVLALTGASCIGWESLGELGFGTELWEAVMWWFLRRLHWECRGCAHACD